MFDKPPYFDPFMPKPSILTARLLNFSGNFIQSYKPVTYFFTVTPNKPIPKDGYLFF